MMVENSEEQAALRLTKCRRRVCLSVIVFGSLCLITSAILLLNMVTCSLVSCTDHWTNGGSSVTIKIYGGVTAPLFCIGCFIFIFLACHKRRRHSSAPEVVISEIPVEDLEKSPSPILPYNHIPHRSLFTEAPVQNSNEVETRSIDFDLPDYFAAVQNTYEASSLNAVVWTEDDPDHETLPPSYEKAIKMIALTASARCDTPLQTDKY